MSTLRSTPPTSDPHPTNHLNGFNEHSYYDPFFATPQEDEELLQISSHTSPDPNLSSVLSSPPSKPSRGPSLAPEAQRQYQSHQNHNHDANEPFLSFTSPPHSSANSHVTESALLSPGAPYTSDNGYDLSDHFGTPEFGDSFYPEDDFGFLPDQANGVDLIHWPDPSDNLSTGATAVDNHPSLAPYDPDPQSASAASLVSHLMSPALTDNPSPGSRDGRGSPTMEQHAKRARAFDNGPTSSAKSDERSQHSGQGHGQMLQTPTLTGSSIDTSPERPTAPPVAQAPGPVFRIESYSRGDSPKRPHGQLRRSLSKRSRSSSHLAVEHDEYSSEEEEEVQESRHDSNTTVVPDQVRTGRPLTSGRVGVDPPTRLQMGDAEIPNLNDQAETQNLALKIADVEEWLAQSEAGSDAGGNLSPPPRPRTTGRRRAKSAGERTLTHENLMTLRNAPPSAADMHIPGPGLVIKEESGDEEWDMDDEDEDEEEVESDDGIPKTPPAVVGIEDPTASVPEAAAHDHFASPPPLYRARVWQDPLYDSTDPGPGTRMQPVTSNDAISRFRQRANDLETLSRAATWGTRRLSESDLEGIFHRLTFKDTDEVKEKRDRRGSFFQAAADKLLPKRSQSILRRKESEANKQQTHRPSITDHKKMDSMGSRKESLVVPTPQRRPSLGKRPKSPRIDTGSAVAAMAGQIAAVGAGKGGPPTATGTPSPTGAWMNVIKRNRSRSDIQVNRSSGNLTDLWTKQGGPPMPTLAAPPASSPKEEKAMPTAEAADIDEDDEDDAVEDKGVTIDLSIRADPITPTMEGFRSNVRQLNPRLPHFLIERIAQEQLRRFKKLIEFKVKHAQALATGKCASGKHCLELGGEATYLPSKSSREAADLSHTGFAVAGIGQSDDDANALAEGVVTPAQFPPGVPMPPVKRLPAEFECSLCFKVKKFHKPSDWSKHVHEDVQPFTCTFQSCAEPKSFKRKADWVRHENERHRQLEWWMCNMYDCNHRCYRKDNFVQHLVREHKLPEPKVKTSKTGKPAVRGPSAQKARAKAELDDSADELDQVWRLVDECRHETPKNPKDEPCKFCDNVCNSWKKLTVHLAKHMEQISMPVLSIAKAKDVTPETIISPIEQRTAQNNSNSPVGQGPFPPHPSIQSLMRSSVSPYGNMQRSNVAPMNDMSGPYASMQPGFYDNEPMSQFQRSQPSTYPPPQQQPQTNFSSGRGTVYNVPAYSSYDSGNSSNNQFVSVNQGQQRTNFQYPPQSSSPEAMYGGMRPPPTSQPRNGSFISPQHNTYPSVTTYPQQGQFTAVSDSYGYHDVVATTQGASLPSFSRSQPPQAMGAPAPVGYASQVEDMRFPQPPPDVASIYGQQGQGYGY